MSYRTWGHKELDMTEDTYHAHILEDTIFSLVKHFKSALLLIYGHLSLVVPQFHLLQKMNTFLFQVPLWSP